MVSEYAKQRQTDPATCAELGAISEQWAADTPGGVSILAKSRRDLESDGDDPGEPCLQVVFNPDHNGGDRYQASLTLLRNGHDREPQPFTDACLPISDIQGRLKESLPVLLETVERRSSLFVEFVVPRDLLNTEFDQWFIPGHPDRSPDQQYQLGIRYPVVVRDLERITPAGKNPDPTWKTRWQRLCECTAVAVENAIRWVDPRDKETYSSLMASLLLDSANGKDGKVCLALLSAPSAGSEIAGLLDAGLSVGLPAAIWLRKPRDGESPGKRDKEHLTEVVTAAELHALPRKVLERRRAAEAGQQPAAHPDRQLSLLWDNPDRLWELPPFSEPILSGHGGTQ